MENEVWKDIPNYEGLYQVSNLGRIKSITHFVENKTTYGGIYTVRGKIINPKVDKGYYRCSLTKNKEKKMVAVHRMVAMAFIPNPENKPFINHINGNTKDNRMENLEWCTQKYNIQQSFKNGQQKPTWKGKTGAKCPNSKKVNQYDLEGKFIKQWDCIRDVERELNIFAINISKCCRGIYKTAGNYKWSYVLKEN